MSGPRDPFELLFTAIAPMIEPTSADGAFMRSLFSPRALKKGEFYQKAGEITTHGGFVVKGCLRTYAIDANGTESIIFFSPETAWVGDISSARTQRPTLHYVDAIEPAALLVITVYDFDRLLARNPGFADGYRVALERLNAARERRIAQHLSATAEERYLEFLNRNPALAARVPQHMLASYLGMTPETLSRIRHRQRTR